MPSLFDVHSVEIALSNPRTSLAIGIRKLSQIRFDFVRFNPNSQMGEHCSVLIR